LGSSKTKALGAKEKNESRVKKKMLDLLFVAITIVLFGVAVVYIYGCDWFIQDAKNSATEQRGERIETMGERSNTGNSAA
jgi:hypothetical protein